MAKPRLIILIRHAQSEGNKNREIHQSIPDHRVKLTQDGVAQAHDAGRRLRALLRPDDKLHFFTSPYRRTRETTEGILSTLTSDDPEPSPFRRSNIKVYEEPRLREQDFGNFQPCGAEMERMWQERADYGHFFYRIPNGESAADAYDRVSGFNESLWRQFGEDDFASVCVLVTHGLMSRVFLMKWYHFTVEYFEDLRNINHCEFLIMRKQDNGKFLLENNLRTWSELRRERAQIKDKDEKEDKEVIKPERTKTVNLTRRWGGCPNGCNHTNHYKKRQDLEIMRQRDVEQGGPAPYGSAVSHTSTTTTTTTTTATPANSSPSIASRRQRPKPAISSDDEDYFAQSDALPTPDIDVTRTLDDPPAADRAPPPLRRIKGHHLHVGRDFGGTYSGHASVAGSDTDLSEDEAQRRHRVASLNARLKTTVTARAARKTDDDESDDYASLRHGAYANRLGDAPASSYGDAASDSGVEPEDLDKAEKEDRSIRGSVY